MHHIGSGLNTTGARCAFADISNQDKSPVSYIHVIYVSFTAITGLFTRLKRDRIIDAHRIMQQSTAVRFWHLRMLLNQNWLIRDRLLNQLQVNCEFCLTEMMEGGWSRWRMGENSIIICLCLEPQLACLCSVYFVASLSTILSHHLSSCTFHFILLIVFFRPPFPVALTHTRAGAHKRGSSITNSPQDQP